MKRTMTLLAAGALPLLLALNACGDDVIDADDVQDGSSRKDATPLPDGRPSSSSSSGRPSSSSSSGSSGVSSSSSSGSSGVSSSSSSGWIDVDAGPAEQLAAFAAELVETWCSVKEGCCEGARPKCRTEEAAEPAFFYGLLAGYNYHPMVATGERVELDAERANSCINTLRSMGCIGRAFDWEDPNADVGGVSIANWRTIREDCARAFRGKGAAGDECYSDIECQESFSCVGAVRPTDENPGGTAGQCKALLTEGDEPRASADYYGDSCSWRGLALNNGGLFSSPFLIDDPDNPGQQVREPCSAPRADGESCDLDQHCTSGSCSPTDELDMLICRTDKRVDLFYCFEDLEP